MAVSVPAGARLTFLLTYEELLPRRLGRYQLSLGLRPGQPVQNLTLDVSITEQTGISSVQVLPLKTSRLLSGPAEGRRTPEAEPRLFSLTLLRPPRSCCRSSGLHPGGAQLLLRSGLLQSQPAAAEQRLLLGPPRGLHHPVRRGAQGPPGGSSGQKKAAF